MSFIMYIEMYEIKLQMISVLVFILYAQTEFYEAFLNTGYYTKNG